MPIEDQNSVCAARSLECIDLLISNRMHSYTRIYYPPSGSLTWRSPLSEVSRLVPSARPTDLHVKVSWELGPDPLSIGIDGHDSMRSCMETFEL